VLIVDANVLIYSVNEGAPDHDSAARFLDGHLSGAGETVGFDWSVLNAFIRLTTHPRLSLRPLSTEEAFDVVDAWLSQSPAVLVAATPRHASVMRSLLLDSGTAANLVNDAHLAALAIEHEASIVSFDADFGRFRGVRWVRPTDAERPNRR
jgi:toxin-antitoxin system PIN domain toxin